jgi:hypothetical protein
MRPLFQNARSALALGLMLTPLTALTAQKAKACALLPRAEAARILGKPKLATAKSILDDDSDDGCRYHGAGFRLDTQEVGPGWSAVLKKMIKAGNAEAVSGIGDEAAFMKDAGGTLVFGARKGLRTVSVTMEDDWGGPPDQLRPTLLKLVKVAAARLP